MIRRTYVQVGIASFLAGILIAACTAGCGRPFLRCSEFEIGAPVDGGADGGPR